MDPGRLRRGDPDLLRHVVREHTGRVLRWVRRYAETTDEAEDLVQDVWTVVLRRTSRYREGGSFAGWLYQVARTVGLDAVRRRDSRRRTQEQAALEVGTHGASHPGAAREPDSLDRLDHARMMQRVREAMAALPERQRETISLRLLDGLSTAEAARAMDCAEGTVKASLSQGLRNLRRALDAGAPLTPGATPAPGAVPGAVPGAAQGAAAGRDTAPASTEQTTHPPEGSTS